MATTYNVRNVIVGAAAVFISVKDSTDPTFASASPMGVPVPTLTAAQPAAPKFEASTDWRHMGYTTDGVEVSYEPDYGDVTVDQMLDSALIFKQGMRVSVNTTLAEASLQNLLVAWGQQSSSYTEGAADADSKLVISAGGLGDAPVERSLAFVGGGPKSATGKRTERLYYVRRALQVETSTHSLSRSDATMFPVSFRCLPEANASGSDYGSVTQRVLT